ncbi:serine/threonine-protein kinase-like protein At1g28390 [Typha latifolia]|uniref:serine/threonine-protein kinase-like protein At1g28390 n=1 Tax=Typha latifolia TaxID=4733 RepID=UPI003C2C4015
MAPNNTLRTFSAAELSAATSDFSPSSLLGRGSHSSVHLAVLDSGRLLAAAKLPSPSSSPSISAHEISLLSSLPRTPFLVNLLGASSSIAVVDLMPLGSLHLHLHQSPPLPFRRRLSLALRAAMAVESLHRLGIAHRDLKPSNILLDARGRPRIADFGLAARLTDDAADLPLPAGTLGYLDPGYVKPSDLSTKTDVYSFGVILFEILSGRRGLDVKYSPPALVEWAAPLVAAGKFEDIWEKGAEPGKGREEEAARMVAEVATRCVREEAGARPELDEVVRCLREARKRARSRAAAAEAWRRVGKWVHGLAGNRKVSDVAP